MRRASMIALVTLVGCTPAQVKAWTDWYQTDPEAATEFVLNYQDPPAPALTNNHPAQWERIAHCESGGQWSHPPVRNRHGTFSGGLMIMNSAWRHFGGSAFAPYAGAATKAEQIEIAERILDDVGWHAWQCRA